MTQQMLAMLLPVKAASGSSAHPDSRRDRRWSDAAAAPPSARCLPSAERRARYCLHATGTEPRPSPAPRPIEAQSGGALLCDGAAFNECRNLQNPFTFVGRERGCERVLEGGFWFFGESRPSNSFSFCLLWKEFPLHTTNQIYYKMTVLA